MNDFASAAMMRVIALGLRRLGIGAQAPEPGRWRGARVPLQAKRAWLEQLHARHGAAVLLRLGEGIHEARDDPALTALALARDPVDLLARWQRLERYVHSRHRVVVEHAAPGRVVVRHVSRRPCEPPHPAEDLLVVGLLVALVERTGTPGLQAHPAEAPSWGYADCTWPAPVPDLRDSSRWCLAWKPGVHPRTQPAHSEGGWLQAACGLLAADPARRWTLADLAHALGTSPRSLQRRLRAAGQTFSSLRTEARLARSAELLVSTTRAPAEVGYLCGFSDQAHFTRLFKLNTALTPARYRSQFSAPDDDAACPEGRAGRSRG